MRCICYLLYDNQITDCLYAIVLRMCQQWFNNNNKRCYKLPVTESATLFESDWVARRQLYKSANSFYISPTIIFVFAGIILASKTIFSSFTGAISILTGLSNNQDGLRHIALSQCGITGKTVSHLAAMLNDNPRHLSTLSHLDLSHNNLKDDVHVSYRSI